MRYLVPLLAACVLLGPAGSAAAGRQENRPVADVTAVSVSVPMKLVVLQGEREALTLEGDERALSEIETVVENGTLRIRVAKGRSGRARHRIRGVLSVKTLASIALAGSGDVIAPRLRGEALRLSVTGSGDIHVGGKVASLRASITGSGDIRAAELEARRVKVEIVGSGDALVWAVESLDVSVAGSGDVRYLGEPQVRKALSGPGTARPLQR